VLLLDLFMWKRQLPDFESQTQTQHIARLGELFFATLQPHLVMLHCLWRPAARRETGPACVRCFNEGCIFFNHIVFIMHAAWRESVRVQDIHRVLRILRLQHDNPGRHSPEYDQSRQYYAYNSNHSPMMPQDYGAWQHGIMVPAAIILAYQNLIPGTRIWSPYTPYSRYKYVILNP
jgi:hypothetical protein